MLIDRSHKAWFAVSTAIVFVAAAVYLGYSTTALHGASGGSVVGLIFGIVGSACMIFAAFLAVRKQLPTWRIGSAQFWLRGHLWLGTVGFVLILFHAGFRWGGLLEILLWLSFGLVVATGFIGVVLQQVIPRLLTTRVPLETMVAQIPFLSRTMLFRADQLVAKQAGPLDLNYEPLKPFAEEVLKQQRVLKRESDLPKELAKVYANVPQPEADVKKAHATETTAAVPAPKSEAVALTAPTAKPKSPLEMMREKAADKPNTEAGAANAPPVSAPAATVKPKSPIELMREKAAAKVAADAGAEVATKTTTEAASPVPDPEKKLSPVELMRAKMAAKQAGAQPAVSKPPVEVATPTAADKLLSPVEIMRAKMAAAKGSPAAKPADDPKPLTVEQPTATPATEQATAPADSKPVEPPAVKKPMPIAKPTSVSAAPTPKPTPIPIPPAQLAELRDFHVRVVRPFLDHGRSPRYRLDDSVSSRRAFSQLFADLPTELHDTVRELEAFCEERRQFNSQQRLHRCLHWWLIFHVPPSIALLVLFVAHVVVSLRVVPF